MLDRLIRLPFVLTEEERRELRMLTLSENISRGKLFAKIIIGIESALAVIDLAASIAKLHDSFHFSFYFIMYVFMIGLNVAFLLAATAYERDAKLMEGGYRLYEKLFTVYAYTFVVWGTAVTLSDQRLYGQVMAFVINVVGISVIFYFNNKMVLRLYIVSGGLLYIGLPFFQSSSNVLIGHYINLTLFLFFTWMASRILYVNFCSNYYNRILLGTSHRKLEEQINRNEKVHLELARANEELQRLSLIDALTEIPNRRAFDQQMQRLLNQSEEPCSLVAILMIDIDYFKPFNDNYGHAEGDRIIKEVAQAIHAEMEGKRQFAARLGGEEFVAAAFDTGVDGAVELSERIRARVQQLAVPHEYSGVSDYLTVSIGAAAGEAANPEEIARLMERADKGLYLAKTSGRNRVSSASRT
ncbi:GGDEF domain-containing protein [Paenibacillus graminis]|uniref:GGDEF domain-containing protein n=1 Tax=Paenibacillus graminis TaxID=189425 RepID=UPI002DBC3F23|nr:GGDEF domain-containing protein [Paenibacillus graminis]MEC0172723.1 GGDEF domain-containing protein [Paenibacillus graminis]